MARLEQAFVLAPRQRAVNSVLGLVYLGDNGAEYADYRNALLYSKVAFEIESDRITAIVLARNSLKLEEDALASQHLFAIGQRHPDAVYVSRLLAQATAGVNASNE